ncbi:MAG: sensor histidine kinase [Sulfurimonas sp.]|jgi:signal transduction histidine kinase
MEIINISDHELLKEIGRRFEEKSASIAEMEFMTKKLLEMNERSKEVEAAKSYFLSLIKNEFNNPLSSLLSLSRKIKKDVDVERLDAIGSMMRSELTYLDFSLKNIFAASEIEYGEMGNDFARITPEDVAEETIEYFGHLIKEKSLTVRVKNNIEDKMVTDGQKLYLILLNLLSNACEYSYPNADINIIFASENGFYTLRVEDFGEGVYEAHSKNIYNRFYKHNTGKTRPGQGLGLGLSVVKELAESLDGSIDHFSENDKTVFLVKLAHKDEASISLSEGLGSDEFFAETSDDGMMEF